MFLSIVIASVLVFVFCLIEISLVVTEATNYLYTVILDAGHGGRDGGVSGRITGVKESDLNLEYVRTLKTCFESNGVKVVLTRNSEEGLYGISETNRKKADMKRRKEIIESTSHDLVISIHMNYFPNSECKGAQTFYYSEDKKDDALACSIQNSVNTLTAINKQALFGDYYILKCSTMPSVIVECGFLSNAEEENLLITKEYRQKMCKAIYDGVIAYLMN